LNSGVGFDVSWNGGNNDYLGFTNGSGLGVQLVNVDGNVFANDLLLTGVVADVNGKVDSGVVYLIKGVYLRSGVFDLNSGVGFDVSWNGGVSDMLGYTGNSGLGVQLVNVDGNVFANDLLLTGVVADVNGKVDSGVVYLINDISLTVCSCPVFGNWVINTSAICVVSSSCVLSGGGVHIQKGGIYIDGNGSLVIPPGYKLVLNKAPDANFTISQGGKLIIRK
jgi:hypothetical protein